MSSPFDPLSLVSDHPFTAADRALAAHVRDDWGESEPWVQLAAACCSLAAREGHAFFDLGAPRTGNFAPPRNWPALHDWSRWLRASAAVSIDSPEPARPLIWTGDSALYLEKFYSYERQLAELLLERANSSNQERTASDPALRAAASPFFVITGGPGTGKTTLALRYLNALLDQWESQRNPTLPPRFAAVAPTGKAAARLAESIAAGLERLGLPADRAAALRRIPCLTIHRLLGSLPHRAAFRRNANQPIPFDALVIDEASMIDLPLMLRLLQAMPPQCQALLLGDKDQLASVDVGSVLHDLLEAAESASSPMRDLVARLTKTYRFREDSAIFRVCDCARTGDGAGFAALLRAPPEGLSFFSVSAESTRIPESAFASAAARHRVLSSAETAEAALAALNASIVLCPTRAGPFGAVAFNQGVERRLRHEAKLGPEAPIRGMPIIVVENDYELELFNGDLGVVWVEADGIAYGCFAGLAGSVRRYRIGELPRHETAYALTIHKSQGSEFAETVALFSPQDTQVLTRELLYTAFSRAKERLVVFGDVDSLVFAIGRQARRATRLSELLRGPKTGSAAKGSAREQLEFPL